LVARVYRRAAAIDKAVDGTLYWYSSEASRQVLGSFPGVVGVRHLLWLGIEPNTDRFRDGRPVEASFQLVEHECRVVLRDVANR
jgi:hypothetical protein